MKIITISRQFGSGGRELGKRLADALGWDYYDREIVSAIAEKQGLDEAYVERALEERPWQSVTFDYSRSFTVPAVMEQPRTQLLAAQRKVLEEIAKSGRSCVIVGRNADVILAHYKPMRIFVCADRVSKLKRCTERAKNGEELSPRQMEQNMRRIDKNRAQLHQFICDSAWGDPEAYDLTINTAGCDIKKLSAGLAELAKSWFDRA